MNNTNNIMRNNKDIKFVMLIWGIISLGIILWTVALMYLIK